MTVRSKEFDLSLLQRDPGRDAMLTKMRGKLAGFAQPPVEEVRSKAVSKRRNYAWAGRIALLAALVAGNYLLIDNQHVLLAKMGYEGVPSLPKPSRTLTLDERALYYTYALYDINKFRQQFGMDGAFAIDQKQVRSKLDDLLPKVTPATLGMISAYTPVGFKSISEAGGNR